MLSSGLGTEPQLYSLLRFIDLENTATLPSLGSFCKAKRWELLGVSLEGAGPAPLFSQAY